MNEYNLTTADLPDTKCLATVKNRPWALQIGFGLLSLALFFTDVYYIGALLLVICILSAIVTQDRVTSKVYEDRLAAFNPKNPEELRIIMFEDIISYELDSKTMSNIVFIVKGEPDPTIDQKHIVIPSFRSSKLNNKLQKLIPDKDAAQLRMNQLRGNRLTNKEIKERKQQLKEQEEKTAK